MNLQEELRINDSTPQEGDRMNIKNQIDLELLKVTKEFVTFARELQETERKEIHDNLIAESVNPAMQYYIESVFAIVKGQ